MTMITTFSTSLFFVLTLFVVIFQWLIFLKLPLGEYTMGGLNKGVLPKKYRITALIQSFILLFNGIVVLDAGFQFSVFSNTFIEYYRWFIMVLMFISMVMNLITKSQKERRLWAPVTVVMFVLSMIVLMG